MGTFFARRRGQSASPQAPLWRRARPIAATVAVVGVALAVVVIAPQSASALDVGSWDAGNIISDTLFYAGTATTESTIQSLLTTQGAGCHAAGGVACLKDVKINITASTATQYCGEVHTAKAVPAAHVFAVVGAACSINPAVLVVLVQKEQSLVTRTTPTALAYSHATGFNCPDSAPCSPGTAGFYTQVFLAAKQFQRYRQNPLNYSFHAFSYNNIPYHSASVSGCGTSRVYIENYATAGLYDYTPYQPDKAALTSFPGTGDKCSSYGNRNFWAYYNNWFGNTGNVLKSSSFEGSKSGWNFTSQITRTLTGATSFAGQDSLNVKTTSSGQSFWQSVSKSVSGGRTYSGSIWIKSASATSPPSTGTLEVYAIGGTTEYGKTTFSVGTTWTEVTANVTVLRPGHTSLRLKVFLGGVPENIDVDAATLSPLVSQPETGSVALNSASLEQGIGSWATKVGTVNHSVHTTAGLAEDGTHFLAVNTAKAKNAIGIDASRATAAGDRYVGTVWVESATAAPYSGTLVLAGLGGTTEEATTPFTVGSTWTPVMVSLPILHSGHTKLRLEIALNTVHSNLYIDNASIQGSLVSDGLFGHGVSSIASVSGSPTISYAPTSSLVPGLIAGAGVVDVVTPATGDTVGVSFARRLSAGETYKGSVWIRTSDATKTFAGSLFLATSGGTAESSTAAITGVSGAWTHVSVSLTLTNSTDTNISLRLISSTPGASVVLDGLVVG